MQCLLSIYNDLCYNDILSALSHQNCILKKSDILGQWWVLQSVLSSGTPTQSLPRYWGAGFVHVRSLSLVPPPQVTVHALQVVQATQLPSTGMEREKMRGSLI